MELFLNILWLLMAAGVLWTWRAHWVHQRKQTLGQSFWEWTAVSVALILLFFAVSMTDDLHQDIVLFDECSANRRGSTVSADTPQPSLHSGSTLQGNGPATISRAPSVQFLPIFGKLEPSADVSAKSFLSVSLSTRAPPISYL